MISQSDASSTRNTPDRQFNHYDPLTQRVQLHRACHTKMDRRPYRCSESLTLPSHNTATLHLKRDSKSKQPTKRSGVILSLGVATGLADVGKEASSMTSTPARFGATTILLTTIWVRSIPSVNETFQAQT